MITQADYVQAAQYVAERRQWHLKDLASNREATKKPTSVLRKLLAIINIKF